MLCNHIILPFSLYANRSDTNNTEHAGGPCEHQPLIWGVFMCVSLKSLHNQQLSSVQDLGCIPGATTNRQEGSTLRSTSIFKTDMWMYFRHFSRRGIFCYFTFDYSSFLFLSTLEKKFQIVASKFQRFTTELDGNNSWPPPREASEVEKLVAVDMSQRFSCKKLSLPPRLRHWNRKNASVVKTCMCRHVEEVCLFPKSYFRLLS